MKEYIYVCVYTHINVINEHEQRYTYIMNERKRNVGYERGGRAMLGANEYKNNDERERAQEQCWVWVQEKNARVLLSGLKSTDECEYKRKAQE
jgi:hypothetical protein